MTFHLCRCFDFLPVTMVNYNEIRLATWGPSNLYGTCPPLCAGTLPVGKGGHDDDDEAEDGNDDDLKS